MSLRIIVTGGTLDKEYDPIHGSLTFESTHLPEILRIARIVEPVSLEVCALVDSLDMADTQRWDILESCRKAPERHIVIVHGTDTMTTTARVLGRAGLEKTIIITGAMVPYSVSGSDALFNLGSAVFAVTMLREGVWIVMNGRALCWDEARKDRERGIFVSKRPRTEG